MTKIPKERNQNLHSMYIDKKERRKLLFLVTKSPANDRPNIISNSQSLQEGKYSDQTIISWIIIPTFDRDPVIYLQPVHLKHIKRQELDDQQVNFECDAIDILHSEVDECVVLSKSV